MQQTAKLAFPFYEDLTTANFKKMHAIAQDSRVMACWSVSGPLRYWLNGEGRIRRVPNIFDTVNNIISSKDTAISNTITIET